MKKHFADNNDRISIRNKVIGLGDRSFHKNYYNTLRHSVGELELFRSVLEEISDILIVIDEKDIIVDLNKAATDFLAKDYTTLKGACVRSFKKLHYENLINSLDDTIQIEECRDQVENHYLFSIKKTTVSESNYKVLIGKDISRLIQSQKEQEQAYEQLYQIQKVETVGQLAGGIAHDFNNILTSIIGAASLMELNEGQSMDQENKKFVRMILESSNNAAGLVSRLMSLSRQGQSSDELFSFSDLLGETIDILKHTIDRKIRILSQDDSKKSLILGDKSRFHSLLLNLGVNASHAIHGSGTIFFQLSNRFLNQEYCSKSTFSLKPGEYLELGVQDTGEGIPESIQIHIFDIFFTTKEKGKGTGLGLSSVMKTVGDHYGEILVESKLGQGSKFTIRIPVKGEGHYQDSARTGLLNGSETILLVDDEALNRDIGSEILHSLGYNTLFASDGLEAVRLYEKKQGEIDLVILDINMPVMDGIDAYTELKKLNPSLKILIATGNDDNKNIQKMIMSDGTDIILKPYRIDTLSKKIRDMVEHSL